VVGIRPYPVPTVAYSVPQPSSWIKGGGERECERKAQGGGKREE